MKAIITAAGYWTRMLPITKTIPKELLPVWNKPVIQYIVEWIVSWGIKDIIIITSQWKESIEQYFDKNYELEEVLRKKWKKELLEEINKIKFLANFAFVKQKQQLWFAHAILEAKPWIQEDYFLLTVGDSIFDYRIFKDIIDIHKQTKKTVIWLVEVPKEEVYKYWVVKIENWQIIDMVEKPKVEEAPSNLIMFGVYILPKKIFNIIEKTPVDPKKWEILLPDSLRLLMQEWEEIYPYITSYKIWDAGTPESWLKANIEIFNNKLFNNGS